MKYGKQKQLAAWVGMSEVMVSQIFKGKKRPSPTTALRLEKTTGIDLRDWLYLPSDELKKKVCDKWEKRG